MSKAVLLEDELADAFRVLAMLQYEAIGCPMTANTAHALTLDRQAVTSRQV